MKANNCPFLWDSFTLDQLGNVYSCCHIQPTIFGNIYTDKLSDLINTKEIIEYREKSQKGKLECYKTCNLFDKLKTKDSSQKNPVIKYEELKKVHIHFGNKCNINCIMCSHPKKFLKNPILLNEKFLIKTLQDHGGKMGYKELNNICSEKFEGVRLILKKLKGLGYVSYDGMMPMFDSVIELTRIDF